MGARLSEITRQPMQLYSSVPVLERVVRSSQLAAFNSRSQLSDACSSVSLGLSFLTPVFSAFNVSLNGTEFRSLNASAAAAQAEALFSRGTARHNATDFVASASPVLDFDATLALLSDAPRTLRMVSGANDTLARFAAASAALNGTSPGGGSAMAHDTPFDKAVAKAAAANATLTRALRAINATEGSSRGAAALLVALTGHPTLDLTSAVTSVINYNG